MSTTKTPIRTVYDNSNQPVGLAEFQTDEVVGLDHGGTGANSAANARISLQLTDSNIRALFSASGSISYNNSTGLFSFTQGNSDSIEEGTTNLFFTNARARTSISVAGAGSYDNVTGVITITGGVTEVNGQTGNVVLSTANIQETTNLYYTITRANTAIDNRVTKSFVDNLGVDAATLDGLDSTAFALDTDLTTANVTESTNLYFTFDRARAALVSNAISVGELTISGNLFVQGNTTTLNTATLTIEDKNIVLANGAASAAAADGAGLTVDGANANIVYLNSVDKWSFNKPIEVSGSSVLTSSNTTTDLSEGNNLYYTVVRANTAIDDRVTKSFIDNLGVDAATLDGLDSSVFALDADLTTANVVENGNLYFTNDRANVALVTANVVVNTLFSEGNISSNAYITSPFFYSESDISLKENIQPIDSALEKVLSLFGVSFDWKANKSKSIGLIAQQVEKVVPEIVSTTNRGFKTVSYDSVIPLLIEAIKEQQEQINDLKSKLK